MCGKENKKEDVEGQSVSERRFRTIPIFITSKGRRGSRALELLGKGALIGWVVILICTSRHSFGCPSGLSARNKQLTARDRSVRAVMHTDSISRSANLPTFALWSSPLVFVCTVVTQKHAI